MAEVYWEPRGKYGKRTLRGGWRADQDPLAWVMSRHVKVQGRLMLLAQMRAQVAQGILAQSKDTGMSEIIIEHGDVDWYVTLRDNPGPGNKPDAMAIEVGSRDGRGGVHPLGIAFPETKVLFI